MSDLAVTSPVERIARVLSAAMLSPNGDDLGSAERPVSDQVEARWHDQVGHALAILRTLREPTAEMVEAGHAAGNDPVEIWNAMVRAALESHTALVGA
jgi:hypothetical protein